MEKITTTFVDELKRPKDKKKKKKKNKKSNRLDYSENIQKVVKSNIIGENSKNSANKINLNEGMIDAKSDKDANKIIESGDDKKVDSNDRENLNQSKDLNKYLNNIINYINNNNMGNEAINKDMRKLQSLILNIVDENKKMKEKIEEIDQKFNEQNLKINELKESVEFLTDECQDMKEMLGNIQFRDLSKNFLRCFYSFLSDEDWKKIRKNKKRRGEIISGIIEKMYPKAEKQKMIIVKELIKNSSNLIHEGNYLAHSLALEQYEKEINAYKKKKNLKNLTSPVAFCFLVNLGISDDVFDNAYSFLTKFFDSDLIATKGDALLDIYFK